MSLNIWKAQVKSVKLCFLASSCSAFQMGGYIPVFRASYFVFISFLKYIYSVSGEWTLWKL